MSKQIRLKFFVKHNLCSALGVLLLLVSPSAVTAKSLIELAPGSEQSKSFQELKQIESILMDVSDLRQLPVKHTIQVGIINRKQLQEKLQQQIKDEIPADKLRGEESLYKQLGMLPITFNYQKFLLDLYTEQIGGFYDPKTKELKLIQGMSLTGLDQQMLIAHELTHALQDQHYDLQKFMDPKSDNDDRSLAIMALIEGDATVASSEYIQMQTQKQPLQGLFNIAGSLFNAAKQMQSFEKLRSAPSFIQNSLLFPYDQGAQFVNAFRNDGWSWQEMSALYQNPPQATEHILHPNAYLDGDAPQAIQFSLQSAVPKSRSLINSVWGELGYRQYFANYLDIPEAKAAAKGWKGDRFEVLETPAGMIYALVSVWDQESEAAGFVKAWKQSLAKRHSEYTKSNRINLFAVSASQYTWVEQIGAKVFVLENLSSEQLPQIETIRQVLLTTGK